MQTYSVEANETATFPLDHMHESRSRRWNSFDAQMSRLIAGRTTEEIAEGIVLVPEKERVVLGLYFFNELTLEEIGSILALRRHAVSKIVSSALSQLQAILDAQPA